MKLKTISIPISTHLLTAFLNSDLSGLSEADEADIDLALKEHGGYFHVICPNDYTPTFRVCSITRMWSDCVVVDVQVGVV